MASVLAGIVGGLGCLQGDDGKASVASGALSAQPQAASSGATPSKTLPKPECHACVMEDLRQAAHRDQVVVTARYLGLNARRSGDHRTNRRCTRDVDVVGVVRFALVGENPWRGEFSGPSKRGDVAETIEADLPCPELSRPQYASLSHYDPDDTERDGLGHAPVLRQGRVYRLTFVKSAGLAVREPGRLMSWPPVLTLVAVNPL